MPIDSPPIPPTTVRLSTVVCPTRPSVDTGTLRAVDPGPFSPPTIVLSVSHRSVPWPIFAVLALLFAGCAPGAQPVLTRSPTTAKSGDCVLWGGSASGPQITVDSSPSGVIALWLPGLDEPCTQALTRGNGQVAGALAADIQGAPTPAPGSHSCPADTGAGVRLYFRFGPHRPAERADIRLTGCEGISGPHRTGRSSTPGLRRDLTLIAPSAWVRYLTG